MERQFLFHCVRVYANGEARETVRDFRGLTIWLNYNRLSRPGNALFVNGFLVHPTDKGYLDPEQCCMVETLLQPEYLARCTQFAPETPGLQVDITAGRAQRYIGYAPEAHRNKIDFS